MPNQRVERKKGESSARPKHLSTVWDYQASYGGELYTVQWENHLLTELCDSVSDLAYDVVSGGTAQLQAYSPFDTDVCRCLALCLLMLRI
jgi:hypothetical protein